jgi:hypothetical protein
VKASIIATEGGHTIINPDAQTLSRWAAELHAETCHSCRRGEQCQRGQNLETAAGDGDQDLPGYGGI